MKKQLPSNFDQQIKYLIGVDGGGTGTRVIISDRNLNIIAQAKGDSSALGQGIPRAWKSILETIAMAFTNAQMTAPALKECAIGIGISGANNSYWKNEFYLRNPGFKIINVDTDGFTTLLGAHQGSPGVIVAVGTGSVGMLYDKDEKRTDISGWGFPSGDEASGAWLGLKASALTQKTLDGRRRESLLSKKVLDFCGGNATAFLGWLGNANQNSYAKLAPFIFESAEQDADAKNLLISAGLEIELMVKTLDPKFEYPLSICGRLGEALIDYLPPSIKNRHIKAHQNSVHGALYLLLGSKE